MSTRINHIGWWPQQPFRFVHDATATPDPEEDFPFGFADPSEAMLYFWRIRELQFHVAIPAASVDHTVALAAHKWNAGLGALITDELDLICCHEGISYEIPSTSIGGGVSVTAYVRVCVPRVVDGPQVKYNPATGLYMPRITAMVDVTDTTDTEYTFNFTNDPDGAFFNGGDFAYASLNSNAFAFTGNDGIGFSSHTISWEPLIYWSHGGTWDTATGEPL